MTDCIFCKIVKGDIPAKLVYEDKETLAFEDINPQAPHHVLIIPKEHILSSLDDVNEDNSYIIGKMFLTAKKVSDKLGISESGVRLINNSGKDAHQTVKHIHIHLLGGKDLGEKLG